jgi:hypothetical protein
MFLSGSKAVETLANLLKNAIGVLGLFVYAVQAFFRVLGPISALKFFTCDLKSS